MSEFIKTKKRSKINGIQDPNDTSSINLESFKHTLETKKLILKDSELYFQLKSDTQNLKITRIRCLALGSPSQEEQALYQLALLSLLVEDLQVPTNKVSIYDPVFIPLDELIFKDVCGYKSEKDLSGTDEKDHVLYFLPHAPLVLTDEILRRESPTMLLSNNILTHTERLPKTELYTKYPLLSKMVSLLDKPQIGIDDFQPVLTKRNRRQKLKFVEPKLNHDLVESFFDKVDITIYKKFEEGPWNNSFTDLALHRLS